MVTVKEETKNLYEFLNQTINILIVDDDRNVIRFYQDILGTYPYYNIYCAFSAADAEAILESNLYINVCIMDMGLTDREGDELYLLKKFSKQTTMMVISGSDSFELGYKAKVYGAKAAIHKTDFRRMHLVDEINKCFLESIRIPPYAANNHVVKRAAAVMAETPVENLLDWAEKTGYEQSHIRKQYIYSTGAAPKLILFIYYLYEAAFEYHKFGCIPEDSRVPIGKFYQWRIRYRQQAGEFKEYFQRKRSPEPEKIPYSNP